MSSLANQIASASSKPLLPVLGKVQIGPQYDYILAYTKLIKFMLSQD